jgi:hypothetical protein
MDKLKTVAQAALHRRETGLTEWVVYSSNNLFDIMGRRLYLRIGKCRDHMKRNWKKGIIGGFSFATALFIFQCCYGTPQDLGMDLLVQGQVKSKKTGQPIQGIKVSNSDGSQYVFTSETGNFDFYTPFEYQFTLKFQDVDAMENGSYTEFDTLVTDPGESLYLEIELDES